MLTLYLCNKFWLTALSWEQAKLTEKELTSEETCLGLLLEIVFVMPRFPENNYHAYSITKCLLTVKSIFCEPEKSA